MSLSEMYLLAGAVILGINTILWLVSLVVKDASIIDPVWSILFLAAALVPFSQTQESLNPRQILLMTLVLAWSLRLALYLLWRNWGEEEDFRYQKWRKAAGAAWWWRSYFKVFVLQGVLAWVICMPLLAGQLGDATPLGLLDLVAVFIWFVGFCFETLGDWQLTRFRNNRDNKGKVLNTGVWRYTRHPNYFGDAAQWWGFYLVAVAAGAWWTVYAPLLMTGLLLKVSGVVLLEKTLVKTKPQYADYVASTPAFFPWFPKKS